MRKGADSGEKTVVDSRDVAGIDFLPPVTQSSADSWYAIVAIANNLSNGGRGPAEMFWWNSRVDIVILMFTNTTDGGETGTYLKQIINLEVSQLIESFQERSSKNPKVAWMVFLRSEIGKR